MSAPTDSARNLVQTPAWTNRLRIATLVTDGVVAIIYAAAVLFGSGGNGGLLVGLIAIVAYFAILFLLTLAAIASAISLLFTPTWQGRIFSVIAVIATLLLIWTIQGLL